MARVNVYAGSPLDRADRLRSDEAWLGERRVDPRSRYVATWRGGCLVGGDDDAPHASLLAPEAVAPALTPEALVVLLGIDGETAYLVADLSRSDDDPSAAALAGRGRFADLREIGGLLPRPDAALLAHAQGMVNWHARHRFCGVCGAATALRHAGYLRVCENPQCAANHFPRTDPAVIMLVEDGDRCLLGRQLNWPEGLYSVLAGFVEPGESLEEAVAREIKEEAGIEVRDVRYHSSQPWPFPTSMMLGFYATAASTAITVNRSELDDARWFHRDELVRPADGFRLPRKHSIARRLVIDWLDGAR